MTHLTRFSFGITSAIVTSLAFIVSLSESINSRFAIIISLLVFAVADNISDALGLHIFQESDLKKSKVVNVSTFSNFFTRLLVVMVFVSLVAFLPINYAVVVSIIFGVSLLSVLSYFIAEEQKTNPYRSILEHLAIAVLVIVASYFLREWIMNFFKV